MATSVTLNGTSYSIPATGEGNWGTQVSNYLIALSTGVLSKAGGAFTLTGEVDFGATYGLKSAYYKSRGTVSSTGVLRLANAESVAWRNAANSADLALKVNSSNILEFNSNPILTLALGSGNYVLKMNSGGTAYEWGKLTTDNLDASAGIVDTQLATISTAGKVSGTAITSGNISTSGSFTTSASAGFKVNGASFQVQLLTDSTRSYLDASGALRIRTNGTTEALTIGTNQVVTFAAAPTITPFSTAGILHNNASGVVSSSLVVDDDVKSDAAITRSKLATGTASHVLINDGSGVMSSEAQLAISRGGTGAATASAALDALLPTQTSNSGKVLGTNGTTHSWVSPFTNPMTTTGDIVYASDNSGTPARLGIGSSSTVLIGGTTPSWGQVTNAMLAGSIADSKLSQITTANKVSGSAITTGNISTSGSFTTSNTSGFKIDSTVDAQMLTDSSDAFLDSSTTWKLRVNGASSLFTAFQIATNGIAQFNNASSGRYLQVQTDGSNSYINSSHALVLRTNAASAVTAYLTLGTDGTFTGITTTAWGTGGTAIGISGGALTTSPSSQRYKTNITDLDLDSSIDSSKIYDVRLTTFNYRKDGKKSFGPIAEEVDQILPCLVHKELDADGNLVPESVAENKVVWLLLAELKKLRDRVTAGGL